MRLPEELLADVDAVAGPRGRTGFVVRALEAALGGSSHAPKAGIGRESVVSDASRPVLASASPRASETFVQRKIRLADERRARERAS